jgi:hypothetical protein
MSGRVAGLDIDANEATASASTCKGRCRCKPERSDDTQKIGACNNSFRKGSGPKEGTESEAKIVVGVEWQPAGKHTGRICKAQPAPHHSDGGVVVNATVWDGEPLAGCLVEEVEEEEINQPSEEADEVFTIPYDFAQEEALKNQTKFLTIERRAEGRKSQQQEHYEKQRKATTVSRQVVV